MNRSVVRFGLAATLSLPMASAVLAEGEPRVLMFVRDGSRDLDLMLSDEVLVMKGILEESGFEVVVATESGEPMKAGSTTLVADLKVADADLSDFAGLALPCMAPAEGYPVSAEAMALVKAAVADAKPILAARGSVAVVAKAGGLDGKKYAFASEVDVKERPEFAGGSYQGMGVVRDGNVSTSGVCPLAAKGSGLPDGTEEVTRRFVESLHEKN
jgi:putative intracellular protease/amidase